MPPNNIHPDAPTVTVYTKPGCPPCDATKKKLDRLGVPHTTRDTATDHHARQHIIDLGYRGTPVTTCGDLHWQGYSPDKCTQLAANLTAWAPHTPTTT